MSPGNDGAANHLLVQAGGFRCALPLERVQRIVPALPVTPLPGAGAGVLGLAGYSGEPLAVLDLASMAGAPAGPHADHPVTVIVRAGRGDAVELVGLAVDAALDIVAIPGERITPSPGGVVRGEATIAAELVRVIDLVSLGDDRG